MGVLVNKQWLMYQSEAFGCQMRGSPSLAGLQSRAAKTEELAMIMTMMIMVMVMTSLMMMTMMTMMTMRGSPSLAGLQRRAAKTDGLMQNT